MDDSPLLNRSEAVVAYERLAAESTGQALSSVLAALPPHLCRELALEHRVAGTSCNLARAMSGDSKCSLLATGISAIRVLEDRAPAALLAGLPLDGHVSVKGSLWIGHIDNALRMLARLGGDGSAQVEQWTSLIVWLEASPEFSGTLLTSSTFPLLPHCTFMTSKALRHIPPNSVYDSISMYALAENIYHESLHQQLAATALHRDILDNEYWAATAPKIPVPWRGGDWEPDRVLHAVFVYAHLVPLRTKVMNDVVLTSKEAAWLRNALLEGRGALTYLADRLGGITDVFSEEGLTVRDWVLKTASIALA